jgi:hypothetical protein
VVWRREAVLLLLGPIAVPASAQSTLTGFVRERADSSAVVAAEVIVPQLGLQATTDAKGRYRFDSIPAGRYDVLVRRLGFDSASATLGFSGDDDVKKDFALVRLGQQLPVVPVTGRESPIRNAKLARFEERRAYGIGHFLTEADLARDLDRLLGNVLQRQPGMTVLTGRTSRYGGGQAAFVATSRGAQTITQGVPPFGMKCPMAIWLDGINIYRGYGDPYDINQIHPRQIMAMEIYTGQAQIPAQFNATGKTCGALVIWTK